MTTSTGRQRRPARANGDRSFAERLSPLIAALGVIAVPNLLIHYQKRLQLTSNELVYLLHVLDHRREESWPWVAVSSIVEATGAGERSVRDWRAALVAKHYLVLRARGRTGKRGGGRQSDAHDLSGLFAALEALALEEKVQRAADQAVNALPDATYYRGPPDVPQLSNAQRPGLKTQRARPEPGNHAEIRRVPASRSMPVSAGSTMPEPAGSTMPVPAEEKEASQQRPLKQVQQHPGVAQSKFPLQRTDTDDAVGDTNSLAGSHFQTSLPRLGGVSMPPARPEPEQLVAELYGGFGVDPAALTVPLYRRELTIARQLIDAGATPDEARAWASDASADSGRRGPIDARAFERERLSWSARRKQPAVVGARGRAATGMSTQVRNELDVAEVL